MRLTRQVPSGILIHHLPQAAPGVLELSQSMPGSVWRLKFTIYLRQRQVYWNWARVRQAQSGVLNSLSASGSAKCIGIDQSMLDSVDSSQSILGWYYHDLVLVVHSQSDLNELAHLTGLW